MMYMKEFFIVMTLYLCMVIHEYADIVGIGDDTVRDVGAGPLAVNVDARAAERGVGEVTVVHGGLAPRWDVEAVQALPSKLGRWSIKLCERERHINNACDLMGTLTESVFINIPLRREHNRNYLSLQRMRGQPLYNGSNGRSQCVLCSEVPL